MQQLFEKIFSSPATLARVEQIFSHSGLLTKPNRAQMGDRLRSQLVFLCCSNQIKSNQIKIYIAPYVHEDSEALGGWITCSRRVGIDEFLNVFGKTVNC